MTRKISTLLVTALPIFAFALTPSASKAQSFTGNYPVSVREVQAGIAGNIKGGNETFCLELTDDGSFGRPHSGTATLEGFDSGSLTGGEFYVIGNNIFVKFVIGSVTGEAAGLVLFGPANAGDGKIGTGVLGLTGGVPSSVWQRSVRKTAAENRPQDKGGFGPPFWKQTEEPLLWWLSALCLAPVL